jgi:hypothetical protein
MPERPRRINVAVTPDAIEALEHIIEREGVTLTEAVRRLLGYGDFVYRAIKDDGSDVVIHNKRGGEKVVELL